MAIFNIVGHYVFHYRKGAQNGQFLENTNIPIQLK